MNTQELMHFRNLLLEERRRHTESVRADQSAALETDNEGGQDSGDLAQSDVSKDLYLDLGGRELQMVEEIDAALQRIEDGTYGKCERCGKELSLRRLEAMPTARFHVECQAAIESARGIKDMPTL